MNVLIVYAPSSCSTSHRHILESARDCAVATLQKRHHAVTVLDLTSFDPVLGAAERGAYFSDSPLIDAVAREHAALVQDSQALVIVYESVMVTLPPSLKGWLDRVLVPGVSFSVDEAGKVRRGLLGLNWIVGICLYQDSWLATKRSRDGGRRILLRCLRMCARSTTRTSWLALYQPEHQGGVENRFIGRVQQRMAKL